MRRLTSLALLAGALTFAACGGDDDDKKSPEAYAKDACTAAQTWVDSIRSGANSLGDLGRNATPQEGKTALQRFFDQAVEDTEKFSDDLDEAGVPDADNGEEASDALKEAASSAKDILERARSQTADLPTGSEEAFGTEARKVGNSTRDSLSRVGDAIGDRRSGELREAFQESPECTRLRAG